MAEQRLIDANDLYCVESLLNTDIVQKSKTASWLMGQVLHDIKASPTINPEDLPVVQQLRKQAQDLGRQLSEWKFWYGPMREHEAKELRENRAAVNVMRKHCEKTISELRKELARVTVHEAAKFTHLSLFSGIGGLDLAAEMAGFCTVGQCEWADYPTKVLEKHWPDVPRWRDIRTLTGESFYEKTGMRTVSIISGGFPCQPHSVIGKQLAENDERHLWPEFIRVVRELRPKYVVGENVNGILSTIHESVCSDLEKEGYEVWTFSIPACAVGAHHERYRVCILGISKSKPGFQADTQTNATGTQRKTRTNNVLQPWDYLPGTYWAVHQPPVCGMDDGIPDWMGGYSQYKERMQCYGNAVVPQQFYPIFQAIADTERGIIHG